MRPYAPASLLFALACAAHGCIPGDSNIVGGVAVDSGVVAAVCTPACSAAQRCVNGVCVGDGLFRATLTWDRPGDLDLHVVTPSGAVINYITRSGGGGSLDRDDTAGTGPENVFWTTAPPVGDYVVCVIPYRISATTSFRLDVRHPTLGVLSRTGTRAPSTDGSTATCSRTSPFYLDTFTIGAATADAGTTDASVLPDVQGLPDVPGFPDIQLPIDVELPDVSLFPDAGAAAD
jgi:hypothetical protein